MQFTKEQLKEALGRVVAERGRLTVYVPPVGDDCVYIHDGCPSCLIGRALVDLGVHPLDLERYDDTSVTADVLPYWADGETELYALKVQVRQDDRKPWGECIAG